ncbi:MAG: AbrB/MazE/SpoVT family DNA-binding domain-containing protein [Candidatus Freyarchaeota archaeon]|nr:AbrB/MazE/SpoVT family DNA-binding domain-containing protein [Candidatus Jordarchaeia archaeon]MBS7270474.1 AbrB/MazE/SpoVT family DNA-binding domain-containing protein [Candidatus Jordarchaeia archaeon]MBS7280557.1 AbrB/MazE/SpoVT family DNA-binding domain-containing protein [Candidatus Jordarchaeia archaeon]
MDKVVRTLDDGGRLALPAEWRKKWGRRVLLIKLSDDEILVRPLRKRVKLTELIDSIEVNDVDDFTDTHKLREALHG